ncbi:MAG: glutamine--fructose-6-phosphate transaminase (isomerizing) [Myxococcota bacterium]
MCGIVGYVGHRDAQSILLSGLQRLEYRGYDSAGIATWNPQSRKTCIRRTAGKINRLNYLLKRTPCLGKVGIGHTRWATHGEPTAANAHPHRSGPISLVHNGIVDNHHQLREQLLSVGCAVPNAEADSAVLTQHISWSKQRYGAIQQTVPRALQQVEGAFALAILDEEEPDKLVCARRWSPLVIGMGQQEMYVASDVWALLPYTRQFMILQDGDVAVVQANRIHVTDLHGDQVERVVQCVADPEESYDKQGHKFFMTKEMHEQPAVVKKVLQQAHVGRDDGLDLQGLPIEEIADSERIVVVACGTSMHAAAMGKYWIEELAGIPVEVQMASEFRYQRCLANEQTALIAVSQSGETADTLGALHAAKRAGVCRVLALCNTPHSSLTRLCEQHLGTLYTHAGIEIGVASTKAFLAQALSFYLLALALGKRKGTLAQSCVRSQLQQLSCLPQVLTAALSQQEAIRHITQQHLQATGMFFIGRGIFYPLALEGALKMKELAYLHAQGYAAGEMKHGPIALVDEQLPVVVLMGVGEYRAKVLANLQEVRARKGVTIGVGWEQDTQLFDNCHQSIRLPCPTEIVCPFAVCVALQALAYHLADGKGINVDQPRNLAKSVTVE